jgi:hypothetical protein
MCKGYGRQVVEVMVIGGHVQDMSWSSGTSCQTIPL